MQVHLRTDVPLVEAVQIVEKSNAVSFQWNAARTVVPPRRECVEGFPGWHFLPEGIGVSRLQDLFLPVFQVPLVELLQVDLQLKCAGNDSMTGASSSRRRMMRI